MGSPKAEIELDLNTEKAERGLDNFKGKAEKSFLDVKVSAEDLRKGWRFLEQGITAGAKAVEEWVEASIKAGTADKEFVRTLKELQGGADGFKAKLGEMVTQSGAAKGGLEALNTALTNVLNDFGDTDGRSKINGFFQAINTGAANSLRAFLGMRLAVKDLVSVFDTGGSLETLGKLQQFIEAKGSLISEKLFGIDLGPDVLTSLLKFGRGVGGEGSTDEILEKLIADLTTASGRGVESTGQIGKTPKARKGARGGGSTSQTVQLPAGLGGFSLGWTMDGGAATDAQQLDSAIGSDPDRALWLLYGINGDDLDSAQKAIDERQRESQGQAQASLDGFYGDLASLTGQGIGMMIGQIQNGEQDIGPAMAKLFGTLAQTIIPQLATMAGATTASGAAAATVGTPAAIVTGPLLAAAVAAFGAASVQGRSGLSSRGQSAMRDIHAGRVPNFSAPSATTRSSGFNAAPSGGTRGPINVVVNFNGTTIGENGARAGREVRRALERADRLGN